MGKSEEKERRNRRALAERQDRVRSILKRLGLWDRLKGTTVADHFLTAFFPKISVSLAEDVPSTPETGSILKSLEKVVEKATVDFEPLGATLKVVDVVSCFMPVMKIRWCLALTR